MADPTILRGSAFALAALVMTSSLGSARAEGQSSARPPEIAVNLPSMTLDEALSFARKNNPRMTAQAARVAASAERAREPEAAWGTRFGATAQVVGSTNNNSATNWLSSKGAVEFPRIAGTGFLQERGEIDWKPYLNTAVGVTGEKRLFDFGRTAAETAAADALTDVERARSEDVSLVVDLLVRETYQAVLSARAVVEVAREAAARATVHRDDARARVTQGMRSRIEQERAEADLARFEVSLVRASGGLYAAQAAFAAAVGVKAPLLDAGASRTQTEQTHEAEEPSIETALREAAKRDPATRAALLQARAASARVHAAEVQTRPEIWVIGTVNTAAGGAPRETPRNDQTWSYGAVPWIPDYFLGAVLGWRFHDPVLDARTETARSEEAAFAAEIAVVEQERVAIVEQAWIGLDVARKALPALERAVAAARSNYQQAETRFQSGLGTAVELADAEGLRVTAELEQVQGRFEVERARARLTRATGGAL
jgi:outer membrane protein TolC